MKKRFLPVLLALCVVFSVLPGNVWAAARKTSDPSESIPPIVLTEADLGEDSENDGKTPSACKITEGCTLQDGHDGVCALSSENADAPATIYVSQDGGGDGSQPDSPALFDVDLFTNAAVNTTVVLTSDIELKENITIQDGQDITLTDDGTPRTIWVNNAGPDQSTSGGYGAFHIKEGGKLTITTSEPGNDSYLVLDGTNALCAWSDSSPNKDNGDIITCRGTFVLAGGTIQNNVCDGAWSGTIVISGEDALFHMTGGVIVHNTFKDQMSGIVRVSYGAAFLMDGGKITSNETMPGGQINNAAVYVEAEGNSSFILNDGEISHNHGDFGGVMVGEPAYPDYQSIATMEMNGGSIVDNAADRYGGGVMVVGGARLHMTDGTISRNQALIGGGIAAYDLFKGAAENAGFDIHDWGTLYHCPAEFIMDGGTISENRAVRNSNSDLWDGGCGGSIYVGSNTVCLNAGRITGNQADRQGGGVYVGSTPYVLRMYDTLVTANTASILGGGLWFCPTGDATNAVTNGGAIFGNTARNEVDPDAKAAGDDFVAVPQAEKEHAVSLADRMLGGGETAWHIDGGVQATAAESGNVLGLPDETPRFDPQNPGERITNIHMNQEGIALKAVVSEAAENLARQQARLIVSGNSAPRGGGIGSNGGIIIGTPEDEWTLSVTKAWEDVLEEEYQDQSIQIYLKIGDYQLDAVTLNQENQWTAEFTQLPNPATLGNLHITVVEGGSEYEASYTWEEADSENKLLSVLVTNHKPEITTGSLTVKKTVSGSGDKTRSFPFEVALDEPISGSYGQMEFTDGKAEFELKHGESITASGLPAGISYTVTETNPYGHTVTSSGTAGTIPKDGVVAASFDNYKSGGGTIIPGDDSQSITVKKVWKLDDGGKESESVTAVLLCNGQPYDQVVLSEGNGWAYTWNGLDRDNAWSVEEMDIPEGFTQTITKNGDTYLIVNDDEPTEPTEPVEPIDPEEPPTPPDPAEPTKPPVPTDPDWTDIEDPNVPQGGKDSPDIGDDVPKTGDSGRIAFWAFMTAFSACILLALALPGKKKIHHRTHQKKGL